VSGVSAARGPRRRPVLSLQDRFQGGGVNLLVYDTGLRTVRCAWRPDFPHCRTYGASEFWHIAWPSGLALARYLATTFGAARVQGRRVLVLGRGVGLESIVLGKLGAEAWALDHVPAALRLVQRNCELR
jgi:hypothetical protein